MRNIAVIFGGKPSLYIHWFDVFKKIERRFHCIVTRKSTNTFSTQIDGTALTFYFCINPIRDTNYRVYYDYYGSTTNGILPPPATEIMRRARQNSDVILFLGLCGATRNLSKGIIHTPESFLKCYFRGGHIPKKSIPYIEPSGEVQIENFLCRCPHTRTPRVVTTNLTLLPEYIEGGSKGMLALSRHLSLHGDVVDKESYEIAAQSNGVPIGLMLMTSDCLYRTRKMIRNGRPFAPNRNRFNRALLESIQIALRII